MKRREWLFASSGVVIATLLSKASAQTPSTEAMQGEVVSLGDDLEGYYVQPAGSNTSSAAVMVFMEAFGLSANIKGVCDRLAQAGYAALAPDFYHGDTYEYTDIQSAITKLKSLNDETLMAEVGKGLEFLSGRSEVKADKVGVIGFCMGGRYVFLANSVHAGSLKAAVSFYGGGIAADPDPLGRPALLDRVEAMQAPIMLAYGAEDSMIAAQEHERIALALSTHKKRYVLSVFPEAGHGFLSDRRDSYNPAAAQEAWEMTLNFFGYHLA